MTSQIRNRSEQNPLALTFRQSDVLLHYLNSPERIGHTTNPMVFHERQAEVAPEESFGIEQGLSSLIAIVDRHAAVNHG